MIETARLILDKGKLSDYKDMYENVWRHEKCARYMYWSVTQSEEDALARMERTIEFQKKHDTFTVYDKASMKAIGFAGFEKVSDDTYEECGICISPSYQNKGYGKEILNSLIDYCKNSYNIKHFIYTSREENTASIRLAESCGFRYFSSEKKIDTRDNKEYKMLKFIKDV